MDAWATVAQVKARPAASGLSDDNAAAAALAATAIVDAMVGKGRYFVSTRLIRPEGCGHHNDSWDSRELVGWGLPLELASFIGPWPLAGPAGGMLAPCGGCRRWSTNGLELAPPVVWDTDHPITVSVDGALLDASKWALVGSRTLIRTDGGIFPQCQDLRLPPTAAGTCEVTYTRGVPPPRAGVEAVVSLAIELAKLWGWLTSGGDCKLPQRLQTITRQGVTATVADSMAIVAKGGTGLTDVDIFVNAINPKRQTYGGSVVTPGFEYDDAAVISGSAGGF